MQRRKRCWQQHVLLALSCVFLISTLGAQAQVTAAAAAASGHVLPFQLLTCTRHLVSKAKAKQHKLCLFGVPDLHRQCTWRLLGC
jgi:hypothetical protein